jgi:hypothetical protein
MVSPMKKLLIILLLTGFIQTSYSAEINLNGLKINLKENQSYLKDYNYRFYLEGSWINIGASQDMMKMLWDEQKQTGFKNNDKVLLVGREIYLDSLKEMHSFGKGKVSLNVIQQNSILKDAVNQCRSIKSKKKYWKCFIDKSGMNYNIVLAYASNKNNAMLEDLGDFKPREISREISRQAKEIIKNKFVKVKSVKTLIGTNTNGDVFIELRLKSKFGYGNMETRGFFAIVDDRLLTAKVDCLDKAYCETANKEFMRIFNQIVKFDENTLTADLSKEEELFKFIGTAQRTYRAVRLAKFLILLL